MTLMTKPKTDLQELKRIIYRNMDRVFAALEIEIEEVRGSYFCTCPIHGGDNPTGFSYSIKDNIWTCWTHNCHDEYNRDVFGLIRGVLSKQSGCEVSFGAVLKWIFQTLSIDNKEISQVKIIKETPDQFQSLVKKFNQKKEVFTDSLGENWNKAVPSDYFIGRGFSSKVLTGFEVGDCTDKDSAMRHRAVIPIHNDDGSMIVASMGRGIYDYIEPKFWFEPGFEKRHYLYNYHRARETAERLSTMFLVEGQGDVWRLVEAGVENVVGIFGKVLSKDQAQKLDKLGVTRLIVLLDQDQAGREAKVDIMRKYGRYYNIIFPKLRTRKDVGQMSPEHIQEKILPTIRGMY